LLETKSIGELCDPKRAITYGIVQPGRPVEKGVPIIRVNNFSANALDLSEVMNVAPDIEAQYRRSRPRPGDVLLTLVGSIGQVAIAPPETEGWNLARAVGLIPAIDRHHAEWIAYALRAPEAQNFIRQNANTTVQATFNLKDLARLPIPYPPQDARERVLELLTALDDKIGLNRRMNRTLEALAQAVFRDWLIDFGPVRRKLAGATDPVEIMGRLTQEPARAAELAALFPESLNGEGLPMGWPERPLDEVADFLNGLALQKYPAKSGEPSLPVIKIAELRGGLSEKSGRASHHLPERYVVHDGDYLFSWSGSLMAKVWTEGDGALNQHLFKVTSRDYPQWFYAAWVQHHMPEFQAIAASKATTMGHIQRGHLTAARTICPPPAALKVMSSIMEPIWARAIQNDLENRTLAETCDYLLPRLISGEVRVAEPRQAEPA
jgi:type I restriction enzyme S subunit